MERICTRTQMKIYTWYKYISTVRSEDFVETHLYKLFCIFLFFFQSAVRSKISEKKKNLFFLRTASTKRTPTAGDDSYEYQPARAPSASKRDPIPLTLLQ